jgi:hypothetical protein
MICTFCGTENPQENRFCGNCGVRLERRKTERRTQTRENAICADCGHANEAGYKFCGMCGERIDQRTQERRGNPEAARATAKANVQLPPPEGRRPAVHRQAPDTRTSASTLVLTSPPDRPQPASVLRSPDQNAPLPVSGPSFLGLNQTEGEGEYLLEEERSSGRGIRFFLLLIVVAAIVGLIFVQYRSSLKANPRSPEPPNPAPATIPRPDGKNHPPAIDKDKDKGLQTAAAAHSLAAAMSSVAKAAALPANPNVDRAANGRAPNDVVAHGRAPNDVAANGRAPNDVAANNRAGNNRAAGKESGKQDDPPETSDAAALPVNDAPSPALIKAQRYLHGQGVRQNCEQGLIYLRAAARENDPRAAVQMGALYSSGICVNRDRVKAYEWFTSARELQPENRWIEKNLNQLWAQMTPQERRQIHP